MINKKHELIDKAKKIATAYYALTMKPLGITGEVAEVEVERILKLTLSKARTTGYDCVKNGKRIQIKGVTIRKTANPTLSSLKISKPWDIALVVVLNLKYDPIEMYIASKSAVQAKLKKVSKNKKTVSNAKLRGQLSLSVFKRISGSSAIWSRKSGYNLPEWLRSIS